jgi:hypothetical protein
MTPIQPDKTTESLESSPTNRLGPGTKCRHTPSAACSTRNASVYGGMSRRSRARSTRSEPCSSAIKELAKKYQAAGDPGGQRWKTVKKELVGQYENDGEKAIPYGICDLARIPAGSAWSATMTALHSPLHACVARGTRRANRVSALGPAAGHRGCGRLQPLPRPAWKAELTALAAETGLEITVCHHPAGPSKWNKIEHGCSIHIIMSRRRKPLSSHQVIVSTIAITTTLVTIRTGLDTDSNTRQVRVSRADGCSAACAGMSGTVAGLHPPPRGLPSGLQRRGPARSNPALKQPGLGAAGADPHGNLPEQIRLSAKQRTGTPTALDAWISPSEHESRR